MHNDLYAKEIHPYYQTLIIFVLPLSIFTICQIGLCSFSFKIILNKHIYYIYNHIQNIMYKICWNTHIVGFATWGRYAEKERDVLFFLFVSFPLCFSRKKRFDFTWLTFIEMAQFPALCTAIYLCLHSRRRKPKGMLHKERERESTLWHAIPEKWLMYFGGKQ